MEHPSGADLGIDVDLALSFAKIARILAVAPSEQAIFTTVVGLALESVDGAEHAGVFVLDNSAVSGRAVSDEFVEHIDSLQLDAGEGPCIDAMLHPDVTYCFASDLSIAAEWPTFGPAAVASGLRSVLSLRLFADRPVALNLYSRLPTAFGALDRSKALILASHAGMALHAVEARAAAIRKTEDLAAGLAMRSVIGQAQGILMERERITADQAFDALRRASQHLNLKLRDVAQRLVDTGESPALLLPTV